MIYAIITIWLLGALIFTRPIAGHIAWWAALNMWSQKEPDSFDWFVGGVVGLFWPIMITFMALAKATTIAIKAFGISQLRFSLEKKILLEEKLKETKELERELGLDDWE